MKRFIPLCLSLMILSQATAFAQESKVSSCEELYHSRLLSKISKRDKYNRTWNRSRGDLSYNGALGLAGMVIGTATGSIPLVLVATLTPTIISTIKNLPSKEERVSYLEKESSSQFKRFVKRLKKDISPDISESEVSELIQQGFVSNLYCSNDPDLYSPKDIRSHVEEQLINKYAKAAN